MGIYLNSKTPFQLFCNEAAETYFIDKSSMLGGLIPLVDSNEEAQTREEKDYRYLCITRPRRFGKTMMATMIASFFGKGKDSRTVFKKLAIGDCKGFEEHINRHNLYQL